KDEGNPEKGIVRLSDIDRSRGDSVRAFSGWKERLGHDLEPQTGSHISVSERDERGMLLFSGLSRKCPLVTILTADEGKLKLPLGNMQPHHSILRHTPSA